MLVYEEYVSGRRACCRIIFWASIGVRLSQAEHAGLCLGVGLYPAAVILAQGCACVDGGFGNACSSPVDISKVVI
jgi:hypothetical protein